VKELDIFDVKREIDSRLKEMKGSFDLFQLWIRKEMNRKNFLGSLKYYHEHALEPLVELLRIKYEPTKKDFYIKHIGKDLPGDVVKMLEDFYKVSSIEDIEKNLPNVVKIFNETLSSLN